MLGNLFLALAKVLNFVLVAYTWIIIARAVLSWVSPDPHNPIVRVIHELTEPVLYRIRSLIPINFGGIDLSPIIVILAVMFLRTFLVGTLVRMGYNLL